MRNWIDTLMDCGGGVGDDSGGGGLEDLVNLATNIADSAPTIRDAAERLLTLLGVDEDEEGSSSEDEGVEVDLEDSEDEDEPGNARLLHELAASLAQELKYAKQSASSSRIIQATRQDHQHQDVREPVQRMDVAQDHVGIDQNHGENGTNFSNTKEASYSGNCFPQSCEFPSRPSNCRGTKRFEPREDGSFGFQMTSFASTCLDPRLRMDHTDILNAAMEPVPSSWGAGWDACASEALRYLVEDEGLPPHHPTVIAMKNHLDLQRERVFAQYKA
ncbi:uncharacterized protein LOC107267941 isoform X2 [Cephus cinctus]|uniref:Uncharacterized protein LOC107267941 isoform X2 n=1 Tax=Cephus cinctus TaxID=211228 RepID=A0AAJ7RHI9_CEPCN|nr:uncharacterized protein LOC107267941 isoform X2 [Cephus cinctus]XP_024941034.1 uncharacterized protein LOC107267941 isoform X2 [Cephus cinctus]